MENGKVKEIEMQGDLENFDPIIANVAAERHFRNCGFGVRSANSERTASYALYDVFVIDRTPAIPRKIPVGAFTLQLNETNRVILRVPPASQRTWGHLSAEEQINFGVSESKYKEHFNYFIKEIEEAISHYGRKATWIKKIWYESKDFIATIIAKFAAEIRK